MEPAEVDAFLFSMGVRQRFTQDTPILPEVWYAYAGAPNDRHDILITPRNSDSTHLLLREILKNPGRTDLIAAAPAALRGFIAMKLTFSEFCEIILPRTDWAKAAAALASRDDRGGSWLSRTLTLTGAGEGAPPREPRYGSDFETARIAMLIGAILAEARDAAPRSDDGGPADGRTSAWLAEDLVAGLRDLPETGAVWRVAMNRRLDLADEQARSTVKADAAARVFEVSCADIIWAIVDSGIDAGHPAFNDGGTSRIVGAYDLASLRPLLNAGFRDDPGANPQLKRACANAIISEGEGVDLLAAVHRALDTDSVDWSSIERLIRLSDAPPPVDGHGTHVAGIIGANWRDDDGTPIVVGLCPDVRLLDLRILAGDQDDTEFAVISALQFVRYLNARNEHIAVHGVNLSLSILHAVENYACGRTPICDECERLVGAGVTVVAAAGNNGYHGFATARGVYRSYATVSITDPGNSESVITVGSTHKREPHSYGISYFSSRGPTGDGRMKPDLVAPGERIRSTLPDSEYGPLDGTSQATPHVSAAAAMLMGRFPELIGQPRQIKQLLCESATDLGRERAFQGHGLLDILRALQSY
jgi:serine protease AprX